MNGAQFMYRLKFLRESELLSQKEVAEKIYVSQRTYSYYENEEHDIPTHALIRLADFYNVSVDYILCRTENPKMNK
jgi:transcriptional regulator with XRE-family HTH domain